VEAVSGAEEAAFEVEAAASVAAGAGGDWLIEEQT
jgi:hypothetical protein